RYYINRKNYLRSIVWPSSIEAPCASCAKPFHSRNLTPNGIPTSNPSDGSMTPTNKARKVFTTAQFVKPIGYINATNGTSAWDSSYGKGACRHLTGGMYRLSSPLRVQPAKQPRCTRVLSCSLEPC